MRGETTPLGSELIGINKGLMKRSGNLISIVNIMVLPGPSVGGTDKIKLKHANAKDAIIITKGTSKKSIEIGILRNIKPKNSGIEEKIIP